MQRIKTQNYGRIPVLSILRIFSLYFCAYGKNHLSYIMRIISQIYNYKCFTNYGLKIAYLSQREIIWTYKTREWTEQPVKRCQYIDSVFIYPVM